MIDDKTDKIIKSECEKIKEEINPPEELVNRTIEKVKKVHEEIIYKRQKRQRVLVSTLGAFTAIVIVANGASFAFKKQDILTLLFSKVDKGIETAIEYGDIHNIDMDYVEIQDGLKMKVEFVLMNEYNFDLVFKFAGIEEFCEKNGIEKIEKIDIPDLVISDSENGFLLEEFSLETILADNYCFNYNNNIFFIKHYYSVNNNFPINSINDIDIKFNHLLFNNTIENYNNINLILNISNFNIDKNKTIYNIKNCPEYIEKYSIILSSTNLKVELYFKDNYVSNINKNNTFLKDTNRNIYLPNDNFINNKNRVLLVFPISNYQDVNNLKLNLDLNKKIEKLTLQKQD